MTSQEIGLRVKAERERMNLTQSQAAGIIAGTQAAYSRKERGEHWFSVSDIARLAEHFGRSTDYLLTGKAQLQSLLSEDEWRLVKAYRKADDQGKADIMTTAFDAML